MFRGIELRQLQLIIVFVVAIAGAVSYGRYTEGKRQRATAAGLAMSVNRPVASLLPEHAEPEAVLNGQVNLNTASATQLELLPGIGPAKSKAIIDDRERNGPFRSVDELTRVSGFGDRTVARIREYLTVGDVASLSPLQATSPERQAPVVATVEQPVFVNRANQSELERLIGVGPALSQRILDYRNRHGRFNGPNDLTKVSGIGPRILEKNQAILRYD